VTSVSHLEGRGGESLGRSVVRFAGFLRRHSFKVFPSSVREALAALEVVNLSDRRDFYHGLRASLVHSDLEWRLFEGLFEDFWGREAPGEDPAGESPAGDLGERPLGELLQDPGGPGKKVRVEEPQPEALPEREFLEGGTYSPVPSYETETLERIHPEDLRFARLALKNMMTHLRFSASRRRARSRRSRELDFRRTFRESLKAQGIPLRMYYRTKRKRLRRLVILADVSGSMDRYARFVLPFIMGIKGSGVKAEIFVFSTTLTRITRILKHHDTDEALDLIAATAPDWSGGTRIGFSLRQFNRDYGADILNHRTVVVVLSDGWDLGAKEMLRKEMAALHQKSRRVIWLNPIVGDPDYAPLLKGMEKALPYIHHHLPVGSLRDLGRAGRVLASEIREA